MPARASFQSFLRAKKEAIRQRKRSFSLNGNTFVPIMTITGLSAWANKDPRKRNRSAKRRKKSRA